MKVGIIGDGRRGIGSRLLAALAIGAGWTSPFLGGNPAEPVQRVYGRYRPTGAALRDPGGAHQAARIEAAAAKRERRAEKLCWGSINSFDNNPTIESYDQKRQPFYIAK